LFSSGQKRKKSNMKRGLDIHHTWELGGKAEEPNTILKYHEDETNPLKGMCHEMNIFEGL
jgi:hypothetical protein